MKLQQTKCKRQGKYTSAISATLKIGITRRRGSFPFQQNRIGVLKCHTYEKHSWCVSTIHIILLYFLATVILWPEIYFKKMSKVEEKVNSLIFVAKSLNLDFRESDFWSCIKSLFTKSIPSRQTAATKCKNNFKSCCCLLVHLSFSRPYSTSPLVAKMWNDSLLF